MMKVVRDSMQIQLRDHSSGMKVSHVDIERSLSAPERKPRRAAGPYLVPSDFVEVLEEILPCHYAYPGVRSVGACAPTSPSAERRSPTSIAAVRAVRFRDEDDVSFVDQGAEVSGFR